MMLKKYLLLPQPHYSDGTAGSLGFLKHGLNLTGSFLVEQRVGNTMHSGCLLREGISGLFYP